MSIKLGDKIQLFVMTAFQKVHKVQFAPKSKISGKCFVQFKFVFLHFGLLLFDLLLCTSQTSPYFLSLLHKFALDVLCLPE
jgi:hypothetical protein